MRPARLLTWAIAVMLIGGVAVVTDDGDDGNDDGVALADEAYLTTELETFDGGTITLGDYAGLPTVVNFFASWCAPCVSEMPAFEEVRRAAGDAVHFVGINQGDNPTDGERIVAETGITWDVGRDPFGELLRSVDGAGMPTTLLLDADGRIVEHRTGATSQDELVDLIAEHFDVDAEPGVIDAPLALAFTAGLLATVNPCGFAMLPAYLSFFLGADGDKGGGADTQVGLSRALAVGLSVSAGFAATFGVIGLIVSHLSDGVYEWSRWITVVVGLLLVALGVALLIGWEPKVPLPRLDKGGRTGGAGSMFVFGVSYGIASLSCTLPLFLPQIAFTFRDGNLLSGIAYFVAYGLGFAVLLTALTVALAVGRRSLVRHVRRVLPWVSRISGALLIVAGGYVAYYGWYEATRFGDEDSLVDRVTGWSADVQTWVHDTGGTRVGLLLALVIAAAALFVAWRRKK